MSHSIDWYIITDVSNELSVSIFKDEKTLESLNSYRIFEAPSSGVLDPKNEGTSIFETSVSTYQLNDITSQSAYIFTV